MWVDLEQWRISNAVVYLTWDQQMAETASTAMAGHLLTHSGRGLTV